MPNKLRQTNAATFKQNKTISNQISEAIELLNTKVKMSPILAGKPTAFYYEVRYYWKYLQYLLSTIDG